MICGPGVHLGEYLLTFVYLVPHTCLNTDALFNPCVVNPAYYWGSASRLSLCVTVLGHSICFPKNIYHRNKNVTRGDT